MISSRIFANYHYIFYKTEVLFVCGGLQVRKLGNTPITIGQHYHLTNIELWLQTHQGITLLLAKCTLGCWMYPTAQITLSPSGPWVSPELLYCQ